MTNQTGQFQNLTGNYGKNLLVIGNGEKLEIVGACSSKVNPLKLHYVLYVPYITKNLLSVSRHTTNNNILVEFDGNCCFVKDKMIRRAILRSTLKYGMYQLSGIGKDSTSYVSIMDI